MIFLKRTYTPLAHAHAGRIQGCQPRSLWSLDCRAKAHQLVTAALYLQTNHKGQPKDEKQSDNP